jgi:hypothetical protein
MESKKETAVKLTINSEEYAEEVADLRRILDAANDVETDWIQERLHGFVHNASIHVAGRYFAELQEAMHETDINTLGCAVEDDVLELGVKREEAEAVIIKDKESNGLEGFLISAPAPMRYALHFIRYTKEHNETLKNTLNVILQVERETDAEKTNALLIEMSVEVARLRELLEDVGYTKSEAWAVVEEMQRFAKADARNEW